ncbi:MAG: hypothetical protein BJ554DRAFT_2154, partial [Olpidium bornovanus]
RKGGGGKGGKKGGLTGGEILLLATTEERVSRPSHPGWIPPKRLAFQCKVPPHPPPPTRGGAKGGRLLGQRCAGKMQQPYGFAPAASALAAAASISSSSSSSFSSSSSPAGIVSSRPALPFGVAPPAALLLRSQAPAPPAGRGCGGGGRPRLALLLAGGGALCAAASCALYAYLRRDHRRSLERKALRAKCRLLSAAVDRVRRNFAAVAAADGEACAAEAQAGRVLAALAAAVAKAAEEPPPPAAAAAAGTLALRLRGTGEALLRMLEDLDAAQANAALGDALRPERVKASAAAADPRVDAIVARLEDLKARKRELIGLIQERLTRTDKLISELQAAIDVAAEKGIQAEVLKTEVAEIRPA